MLFRNDNGADITDEEFAKLIEPFEDECYKHLHDNLLPEYVSFYLATGFKMNSLSCNTYKIHINSAADVFNIKYNYEFVKNKVTSILSEKYRLRVISEEPLDLKNR